MQAPCPSIGIFKPLKAIPSSTALKSLTNTRWCWGTKPWWLFLCVDDVGCSSYSQNWRPQNGASVLNWLLGGTQFFMFHLSIGRGRRNSKNNTCFIGVDIRCLRMKDMSFSCLIILTLSLFPSSCFLCGMGIIGCRLGCFTLIVCMMMSPLGTSLLIPLSLIPFMGLFSSSLPQQSSTCMFLTFFFFLH